MTALLTPPVATPPPPRPYRWTAGHFFEVRDACQVWPHKNVILIDGEVIEMPLPDPIHDMGVTLAQYLFMSVFATGHSVRVQLPLPLNINTDPYPDICVVPGTPRTMTRDPKNAVLVVEVSNTSLDFDLTDKASLYAAAGIRDYWVIDLDGGRVVVHRDPVADAGQKYGHRYATVTPLGRPDAISPLAAPTQPVTAGDLLP